MIIAFLAIAVLLALAVHEVGHALGGRLRGMRLGMLIVGPVHIQREADDACVDGSPQVVVGRRGGIVRAARAPDGLRRAMLSFAAGGPVTSVVGGVLVLTIYVLADLGSAEVQQGSLQDALSESTFMLGMLSFGIGLVTLLPVSQERSSTTASGFLHSCVRAQQRTATRPSWDWVAARSPACPRTTGIRG